MLVPGLIGSQHQTLTQHHISLSPSAGAAVIRFCWTHDVEVYCATLSKVVTLQHSPRCTADVTQLFKVVVLTTVTYLNVLIQ